MRRLMIPMSAEVVLELMKHSKRAGLPISALVVRAVEAWLGSQTAPKKTAGGDKRISGPCSQGKRRRTASNDATSTGI